jgi:hypothetical protein
MIPLSQANKLLDIGYSLITVDDKKVPNYPWKAYQSEKITKEQLEKQYKTLNTAYLGYVTGFNDLEVIDIDLKIFSSLKEQKDFWDEYLSFLKDNIDEFDKKFVIYKTMKQGYHIVYRCKTIQGNTKIAKLEGYKEALIESRGTGGYCILYENKISELSYHEVKEIDERDREILWSISRTYDFKDVQIIDEPKKSEYKPINESEISPWQEYNDKHTALDVISDEFTIVRQNDKQYIIKRHGASSPHSGYIYKSNGCMYLFSTGTQYPNEKLLSPFAIYSYKNHNGDFTKAASDLYQLGYGTRKVPKVEFKQREIIPLISRVQFPIEIFPIDVQKYIIESSTTLGLSVDYMGCAFLWMLSLVVGNSIKIEVKPGWVESPTLWIAVVGKPGIGKTPSINQMIFPLREKNIQEQKEFQRQYAKWIEYDKIPTKEKAEHEEIKQPKSKQFIVGDITLEALVDLHEDNPNALGVFKDELAGWFKDMNKYRAGSDLEFWLSSWSGTSISLNRKTAKSSFVDKPFIPVLGGIQPSVFEEFTNGNNKENGFVDRILISYPELFVNKYNDDYMMPDIITWYRSYILRFKSTIDTECFNINEFGEITPIIAKFDNKAQQEWKRIHDKITDIQNSDSENEYMKSMLPKQKSYIPRFALLLNTINEDTTTLISKQSIIHAEKLSEYFVNMAKLVKQDVRERLDLVKVSQAGFTPFEKFKAMYKSNPEINRTTASELLEVSRQTVMNWIKKLEETNN